MTTEENHGRSMHGEHAVKNFGRNEMVVRNDELYAHDRRFDTANDEEHQRVKDVQNPQLLVIHVTTHSCSRSPIGRRAWSMTLSAIVSEAMLCPSSKRFEIRRERVQIVIVQFHCRHQRAGFNRARILNPRLEIFGSICSGSRTIVSRLIK